MDDRKVRWLCRRGMKELDVMLGRYLDERWPQAGEGERAAFVDLLEMQDPDLWNILQDRKRPVGAAQPRREPGGTAELTDVIARIRALSGL